MTIEAELIARGFDAERARLHVERYERTVAAMRPWLPEIVGRFLDIGSGTGGIAAMISGVYPYAEVNLIDGESAEQSWTSFRPDGAPWAAVEEAKQLVKAVRPSAAVYAYSPPIIELPACGLIYSICSWGHHYPIETYLELVRRSLKPGGTLIVDLRKGRVGAHGREMLGQHFLFTANIGEGKKYDRTVWRAAA